MRELGLLFVDGHGQLSYSDPYNEQEMVIDRVVDLKYHTFRDSFTSTHFTLYEATSEQDLTFSGYYK